MFDQDIEAAADATTAADKDALRIRARGLARRAADRIAPLWPLETFIACNPLLGLEEQPFEDAAATGAELFGGRSFLPLSAVPRRLADGRISENALDAAFASRFGRLRRKAALGATDLPIKALLRAHLTAGVDLTDAATGEATDAAAAQAIKWCASYFSAGAAGWALPGRENGLWACWRGLAPHDATLLKALDADAKAALSNAPDLPEDALNAALDALGLGREAGAEAAIAARLAKIAGWSGFVKWAEANPADWSGAPASTLDLAAMAMTLEALLKPTLVDAPAIALRTPAATLRAVGLSAEDIAAAPDEALIALGETLAEHEAALRAVALDAAEETFRDRVLGAVAAAESKTVAARPMAQAVFCIDVRSEPFRRRLEAAAEIETIGYAGFFGLPMRLTPGDGGPERSLCPVLLSPAHHIAEAPRTGAVDAALREATARARIGAVARGFEQAKKDIVAPFALAEAAGFVSGAALLARTLAPRWTRKLAASFTARADRADAYAPDLSSGCGGDAHGLSLEARVYYAQAMFSLTGMGAPTGRLIAIIGHGGETVNNAYGSALDCGACGGAAGGPSAKAMARILNDFDVREKLKEAGYEIPEDCIAIAGQHNTTTDEVTLYARDAAPETHVADLAAFEAALAEAGSRARAARAIALPDDETADEAAMRRAGDWAEVRPEWGLAGCGAFIVGPRSMTAGADLSGRAFLHSYAWEKDQDGSALTVILTAPMVVAEWISTQYYFSTVDPEIYGSGDKTVQNVVGGIGVMRGAQSDLLRGLPLQSTHDDDGRPYHEPLRLMTLVEAPVERVEKVISANPVLQKLFGNGWVALHVLDPVSGESLRYATDGQWKPHPAPQNAPARVPPTGEGVDWSLETDEKQEKAA